jgi:hypothetical protein
MHPRAKKPLVIEQNLYYHYQFSHTPDHTRVRYSNSFSLKDKDWLSNSSSPSARKPLK